MDLYSCCSSNAMREPFVFCNGTRRRNILSLPLGIEQESSCSVSFRLNQLGTEHYVTPLPAIYKQGVYEDTSFPNVPAYVFRFKQRRKKFMFSFFFAGDNFSKTGGGGLIQTIYKFNSDPPLFNSCLLCESITYTPLAWRSFQQ